MLKRRLGRHFVTVGDADGMNPAIEQLFRVLQKSAGENDDSGRPVAWKKCRDAENRVRERKTSLVNQLMRPFDIFFLLDGRTNRHTFL